MKKYRCCLVIVLCVIIIGLSILKNGSFNTNKRCQDSLELQLSRSILKQSLVQDSLLQKIMLLDSIYHHHKANNSAIQQLKSGAITKLK